MCSSFLNHISDDMTKTLPIYNEADQSTLKPGMYLGLFHGRDTPEEELDNWGFNGPMIGPLKYVHTTYAAEMKLKFESHDDWKLAFPDEPAIDGFSLWPGSRAATTIAQLNANPARAWTDPAIKDVMYAVEGVIPIVADLVKFQGKFYGDWTIFNVQPARYKD